MIVLSFTVLQSESEKDIRTYSSAYVAEYSEFGLLLCLLESTRALCDVRAACFRLHLWGNSTRQR